MFQRKQMRLGSVIYNHLQPPQSSGVGMITHEDVMTENKEAISALRHMLTKLFF